MKAPGLDASVTEILQRAERLCNVRGVRLTPRRRKVLEILCLRPGPMGAYQVLEQLAETVPGAKPPMVYRALEFLQQQGLIHRLESINAFIGCAHPDHPHAGQFLICDECGQVWELEDDALEQELKTALRRVGFQPCSQVVEVTGRCARCSGKQGMGDEP